MKLRPRFFDGTAFKKDITRFAPLWVLYLIGGLMVAIPTMGTRYSWESMADVANRLSGFIVYIGIIILIYSMLCAQLLHGDVFNNRMCNALHAMPVRRENWFVTHTLSGLLFSLMPNLVLSLAIMPFLQEYWYTALLWLLGMEMHFVFFYGLAAFSIYCTGNRFAAIVVYTILNFLSVLVAWFATTMYQPMLYGVELDVEMFLRCCPVANLVTDPDYFKVIHPDSCPCRFGYKPELEAGFRHVTYWGGMGSSWGYLGLLTGLGVVFFLLALVLYRARQLETAGDFVAFKAMRPVFWVLFSLCAGGAVQLIGVEMMGVGEDIGFVFLGVGLVCGYFAAQMLIARSAKVFKKRIFLHLGIFLAVFVLSLVFTALDVFGITRYVPDAQDVKEVYVSDYRLSDWNMEHIQDQEYIRYNVYRVDSPEEIEQVRSVHEALYREGGASRAQESIYITYVLKNGTMVRRTYTPAAGSEACRQYWDMMARPEAVLKAESLEALKQMVSSASVDNQSGNQMDIDGLLEALWKDAESGNLYGNYRLHRKLHGTEDDAYHSVELWYGIGKSAYYLPIYNCGTHTLAWSREFAGAFGHFSSDYKLTAGNVSVLEVEGILFEDTDILFDAVKYLYEDIDQGKAVPSSYGDGNGQDAAEMFYFKDGSEEKVNVSTARYAWQ